MGDNKNVSEDEKILIANSINAIRQNIQENNMDSVSLLLEDLKEAIKKLTKLGVE